MLPLTNTKATTFLRTTGLFPTSKFTVCGRKSCINCATMTDWFIFCKYLSMTTGIHYYDTYNDTQTILFDIHIINVPRDCNDLYS